MMRRLLLLVVVLVLAAVAAVRHPPAEAIAAQAGPAAAAANRTGKAFRFNEVRDGVFHAIGTGALTVIGNAAVIVNDNDAVVVDDHVSPAAARALLEEMKEITDKPVRTVINTHFHFDHAHGNQIFGPGVDIVGHEFTRQMLLGRSVQMPLFRDYLAGLTPQIDDMKKRLATEPDAARQAALRTQIQAAENNRTAQAELKPTPPNVTLTNQLTLHRGSREIQIRFLGRGHTAGDVVVYLPGERLVITGDFLTSGLSNMSDAYVDEWVGALDALQTLDFDTVLPGHGEAFADKAKIGYFQDYLRDVWEQVGRLKREGATAEEAAKRADLTRHRTHFPNLQNPGVPLIGVTRIYELLDQRAQR